jgi:protein TonB
VDKKEFPGYKPMDTTQYTKTYTRIDKAAVCSGGRAAWLHYLGTSLSIPKEAVQNNIQGTVVVEFEVTPDGEIQNAHVIQSPNAVLNAEALRLINESPLWEPAEMDGIKVKALIRQPITFRL